MLKQEKRQNASSPRNIINILKCLLCLGVVIIHTTVVPHQSMNSIIQWKDIDYSCFIGFRHYFVELCLNKTCIPVFFFISGYLFFKNTGIVFSAEVFKNKIFGRVRSLLIPYFIANTMMLLIVIGIGIYHHSLNLNISKVLSAYWDYDSGLPINGPTWFLRDLFITCLYSPIIFLLLSNNNIRKPYILLLLIWWMTGYDKLAFFPMRSLCFFSMGAVLSICSKDIIQFFRIDKYGGGYLLFYIVLWILSGTLQNVFLLRVSVIVSVPAWIYIAQLLSRVTPEVPQIIVTGSFFCYLFHYCYINLLVPRTLLILLGASEPMLFVSVLLGATITFILLDSFFYLLYRLFPKSAGLIVGGRS